MAGTSTERQRDEYLFNLNMEAANQHKTEDFKPGEHVYVWLGTFAGTTTAVVEKAEAGSPTVSIRFEDDNLPPSLEPLHNITPRELMHEGEFKA